MTYVPYRAKPPRPLSWADVYAITGELHGVSIRDIEQGDLVWPYDFTSADMRPCGREGCRQIHGHGWIVALKDGRYVHIGNDCARKYANAELWSERLDTYNERVRKEAQDRAYCEAHGRAQSVLYWLDNNDQLPVSKRLFVSVVDGLRGPLLDDLRKRAERGDAEVTKERRLTAAEISDRRQAQTIIRLDGTTYTPSVAPVETVKIGRLRGLGCFSNDICDLLRLLERDAMFLLKRSHGEMSKNELDDMRRISNEIGNAKRRLERAIDDLRLFLDDANMRLLTSTELARSQGVLGIHVEHGQLFVTKRSHWDKRVA